MARARNQRTNREYSVDIVGLQDFTRALRLLGEDYPEEIKKQNKELADRIVLKARLAAAVHGGTVAKGARSMKATNNQKFAAIIGGGSGSKTDRAVFFGAEFGGRRTTRGEKIPVNARGPSKQKFGFKPWRGNQWGGWNGGPGYFLNPTIRTDGDDAVRVYLDALKELERRAFPD